MSLLNSVFDFSLFLNAVSAFAELSEQCYQKNTTENSISHVDTSHTNCNFAIISLFLRFQQPIKSKYFSFIFILLIFFLWTEYNHSNTHKKIQFKVIMWILKAQTTFWNFFTSEKSAQNFYDPSTKYFWSTSNADRKKASNYEKAFVRALRAMIWCLHLSNDLQIGKTYSM